MQLSARIAALSALTLGLLVAPLPARAEQGSLAQRCPAYARHLVEARASLASGDQGAALTHLDLARESLSSCIRFEAEVESMPTMLAAAWPGQSA